MHHWAGMKPMATSSSSWASKFLPGEPLMLSSPASGNPGQYDTPLKDMHWRASMPMYVQGTFSHNLIDLRQDGVGHGNPFLADLHTTDCCAGFLWTIDAPKELNRPVFVSGKNRTAHLLYTRSGLCSLTRSPSLRLRLNHTTCICMSTLEFGPSGRSCEIQRPADYSNLRLERRGRRLMRHLSSSACFQRSSLL